MCFMVDVWARDVIYNTQPGKLIKWTEHKKKKIRAYQPKQPTNLFSVSFVVFFFIRCLCILLWSVLLFGLDCFICVCCKCDSDKATNLLLFSRLLLSGYRYFFIIIIIFFICYLSLCCICSWCSNLLQPILFFFGLITGPMRCI